MSGDVTKTKYVGGVVVMEMELCCEHLVTAHRNIPFRVFSKGISSHLAGEGIVPSLVMEHTNGGSGR